MPDIKMDRIFAIESSNKPKAFNEQSGARGLGQITEIALKEWNQQHPEEQYTAEQLFDSPINEKISNWYMNTEVPRLLKHYKLDDSIENRLAAYNFGIGNLSSGKELPEETTDYIIKYMMGGDVRKGQKRLKEIGFDPGALDGMLGPKTRAAWKSFQDSDITAGPSKVNFGIHNLKEKE